MPTVLGKPLNRVDGRQKVTGRATYAADHRFDNLAHAYGVSSMIAAGEVVRVDASEAERAPGVLAVFHADNFPATQRVKSDFANALKVAEARPPLSDKKISYAGQWVALVVAETFEQARWAARLVRVSYRSEPPTLTLDEGLKARGSQHTKQNEEETDRQRGDPARAFADAPEKIEATYLTPVEVHNPMEMHATTARWEGERLIVYDSTQWVVGQRNTLARALDLDPENVVVHAPFIGGGFGGKLFLWPHSVMAAVAARQVGRPVRFMLARRDQFTAAGHRPATRQTLRLGATADGKLLAIQHDTQSHTSLVDDFLETCGRGTRSLYRCANVGVTHRTIPVNVGTPTSMRAPGAASGLFALESAMDELAVRLKMDPLELRRKNLPDHDEDQNIPWSSNHLEECYRAAAERFGWSRRNPAVGAMREGRQIIGWGLATAYWPSERQKAKVRVALNANGTARVSCATQDIGTGTYTVFAQVVSELTTLPFDRIEVVIGDSSLSPGPISGGSMVTASVTPAIAAAARQALHNVFAAATRAHGPFAGDDAQSLSVVDGVFVGTASGKKFTWREVFEQAQLSEVVGETQLGPGPEEKKFSFHSFGAHCVEVGWDPGIAKLRVRRIVTAVDAGQIINPKTAANQVHGSLIMGLGMALQEESIYDSRTGCVVTDNLADYHMPVHADLPDLDVILLNRPDPHNGEFGVKGIGEIGITGIAAAIANAVHHATGKRIRELPISIERLLA